ncbi:hypothetical protein D3C86_1824200 [compost metagenome]
MVRAVGREVQPANRAATAYRDGANLAHIRDKVARLRMVDLVHAHRVRVVVQADIHMAAKRQLQGFGHTAAARE